HEAQTILRAASGAVDVVQTHVREFAAPYRARYVREFILGGQDHLTSGEVEIFIWARDCPPDAQLPPGDDPAPLEVFQFNYQSEKAVKAALTDVGHLNEKPDLDESIIDAIRRDMDYSFAWTWEGAHADLIRAVGQSQHEMELIPGLLRADDPASV